MAKTCPSCGLINLDCARECDCRYTFENVPSQPRQLAARVGSLTDLFGDDRVVFYGILYVILAVLALITVSDPELRSLSPLNSYQWGMLFFVLVVSPFWILWKAVKRFRGRYEIMLPTGSHVLYLRPFSVDSSLTNEMIRFLNRSMTLGPLRGDTTLELGVAAATRPVGEFVAIGCPADFVAPDGAKRIYVGDDSWQQKVRDLLQSARVVVMVAGTTDGVSWEMKRIRECVEPRRLLLILPSAGREERQRMAEVSSLYLRTKIDPLPANEVDAAPLFYTFNAAWEASALKRVTKQTGIRLFGFEILPQVADFDLTLSPLLESLPDRALPSAAGLTGG